MGIYGDVPSQIEADDDVQDNDGPEPGGTHIKIKADEEEDKEEGEMDQHSGEAIGGEALRAGKGPDKVRAISLYNRPNPHLFVKTPIKYIVFKIKSLP
jgi:hypothetical protein